MTVLVIDAIRKTVSSVIGVRSAMSATPVAENELSAPSLTTPTARPTAGHR